MFLKAKPIALALAAVAGLGAAAQASAVGLPLPVPANALKVFMSGASAQDSGVLGFMRRACASGTLSVFTNQTSSAPTYPFVGDQALYLCQNGPAAVGITGLGTFVNLAVYKTSRGGSGNGVQPVNYSQTLAFFSTSAASAAAAGCSTSTITVAPTVDPTQTTTVVLGGATVHIGCTAETNTVPDIGFSDVEPALFAATSADFANLTTKGANALIFGIPVSKSLYALLQTQQGLGNTDSVANIPTLSRLQIAAVFNQSITDDSVFGGPGNPFYVLRRTATSGTQVWSQVYFLNKGCFAGADSFVSTPAFTNCAAPPAAGGAFLGGSSQAVKNCFNALPADASAIGILSTEFPPASTDDYRFVRIDGVTPALLNAFNGQYTYVAAQAVNWRKTTNPLSGVKLTFGNQVLAKIGSAAVVSDLDTPLKLPITDGAPAFHAGLLGLLENGGSAPTPANDSDILNNPLYPWTKAISGGTLNCSTPQFNGVSVETKPSNGL